jgi:AcrR family transcriptional regulator
MEEAAERRPGRRPGPSDTRVEILRVARELFAERGYDRTSVRAIARGAGVDPALVHHFYGTKEGLFVAAVEFPFDPAQMIPQIIDGPPDAVGERLARAFFSLWEDPRIQMRLVGLFRTAMTSATGAAMLREFLGSALLARIADSLGVARVRVGAAASQMIGVAMLRYVVGVEPMAAASVDELVGLVAPTLQRYLTPTNP